MDCLADDNHSANCNRHNNITVVVVMVLEISKEIFGGSATAIFNPDLSLGGYFLMTANRKYWYKMLFCNDLVNDKRERIRE